jgi:Ca2+-binding RTX toxin-like protein
VPEYAFSRYSGFQVISRDYGIVRFDEDIHWEEVVVSRDGIDLVLALADGSAQGRVEGWYADPAAMPQLSLQFSADPEVSAEALTELGLRLNGTDGDDVLTGTDSFGDVIYGGPGNDVLDGGAGKDTYVFLRGDGVDQVTEIPAGANDPDASVIILDDFFSWEAHFGLGSLLIDLGNGDAIHFMGFDPADPYSTPVFDRLEFAGGESLSFADVMAMGFQFFGSDDDEVFTGTGVNDFIDGAGGDDAFYGLRGDDVLQGGEGSDLYVYSAGGGNDYVLDWDETPGEVDTLRLEGIAPEQVRVTRDDYSYYAVLDDGARIMLDSAAREAGAEIERVEFDDGTVWSAADLAARVELLPGTERDDPLWGTAQGDVIYGLGGNDALFGNRGDDFLAGGEGSDIYLFAPGDGADVVDNHDEDGSFDEISFSEAASADATLTRRGDDLVISVASGGNQVSLRDWYADTSRKIDLVYFGADSESWDAAMLEALAPEGGDTGGNAAPEVANPMSDQIALEDEAFSFAIPEGTFSDADADELAYGATLGDGSPLPAWLSFDPELRVFSGIPANGDVGLLELAVTVTDGSGESATDTFDLDVLNTNDAPVAVGTIADATAREGQAFSLNIPESIFADPDAGDSLTLSANGPAWLSLQNGVLSGTPGFSDAGEYVIEVTATDGAGASAGTRFQLSVGDVPTAGNRLTGTPHDDVLIGTDADEVLRGRRGDDLLIGGGGDDILRGGRGDDLLRGGTGNDVYIHGRHGGDDQIIESGGVDVLRFGEGITRAMVSSRRVRDDLVLDVSGANGSVTVKDWFGAQERRVERIEFAGGAVWDEDKIRSLVRKSEPAATHHVDLTGERKGKTSTDAPAAAKSSDNDVRHDGTAAALWQRLANAPGFDFEALLRAPGKPEVLSPKELARRWALAHSYASALAFEPAEISFSSLPSLTANVAANAAGFGFEASVGASRTQDGLKGLEGLTEGFRKL